MFYFLLKKFILLFLRTRVSICLKYCDELYANCKTAEYGGKIIGHVYRSGRAFCEAQDFKVIESNNYCFEFDSTPFSDSVTIYLIHRQYLLFYFLVAFLYLY